MIAGLSGSGSDNGTSSFGACDVVSDFQHRHAERARSRRPLSHTHQHGHFRVIDNVTQSFGRV